MEPTKRTHPKYLLGILVTGLVIVLAGASIYYSKTYLKDKAIATFEQCAEAGYPIMESYPRQCRTRSGNLFVESVPVPPQP